MKTVLILLSLPFAIIGFIWAFIRQGFEDGVKVEEAIRECYAEINNKDE